MLTEDECNAVTDTVRNIHSAQYEMHSSKNLSSKGGSKFQARQRDALTSLAGRLSIVGYKKPIEAVITGRKDEVVIKGVGAIGVCKNLRSKSFKGDNIKVIVRKITPEKGFLLVEQL